MEVWQTGRITVAYAIGLALVAAAATAIWFSTTVLIDAQQKVAVEVNVAGRQRMLTQRIVLQAEIAVQRNTLPGNAAFGDGLDGCVDLMLRAHAAMLSRDVDLLQETAAEGITCLPGDAVEGQIGKMSPALHEAYFVGAPSLDEMLRGFAALAKQASSVEPGTEAVSDEARLEILKLAISPLPALLDSVVQLLQSEGEAEINRLQELKTWLWLATLLLLILEVIFIFRPLARRTQQSFAALKDALGKSKEREAALIELQTSLDSRGEFLAHMSHELRTPLNAIIGFADFLSPDSPVDVGKEKRLEYVADIKKAGEHLLSLVNDVLDLSRIDMDALRPVPSDVDLRVLIKDAVEMISPMASDKSLTIRTNMSGDPALYHSDPRLIRQILLNVLSNAVKYNRVLGSITIDLRETADSKTGQAAEPVYTIRVTDTGQGISEDGLAAIFQPFGQALSDPMVSSGGIGIGLPLSARIAELLGGRLDVTSEKGRGTTVTLVLPIAAEMKLAV